MSLALAFGVWQFGIRLVCMALWANRAYTKKRRKKKYRSKVIFYGYYISHSDGDECFSDNEQPY